MFLAKMKDGNVAAVTTFGVLQGSGGGGGAGLAANADPLAKTSAATSPKEAPCASNELIFRDFIM
jgi:hypothetical protein